VEKEYKKTHFLLDRQIDDCKMDCLTRLFKVIAGISLNFNGIYI
jgi:hypothetical protein